MNKFSFKNRLAFNYIFSTGILILVLFIAIFLIVKASVYNQINSDIESEVSKHLTEIEITDNHIGLIHDHEWQEREHNTVAVNPVFVQFYNAKGELAEKSPNLKIESLKFNKLLKDNAFFDTQLTQKSIRQIQVPLFQNKTKKGYLLVAMSLQEAKMVLDNLLKTLLISYPIILIILFVIARFIAGKSIKPISSIIETANKISTDNLKSRIKLPFNNDELYDLSNTINNLLDRLEDALQREKQFTSDASHELRTPLSVIKGTLEVLIRKPRNQDEYESKAMYCISEVNRLNIIVDQLLLLARLGNQKQSLKIENILLNELILDNVSRQNLLIQSKKIIVKTNFEKDYYVQTDGYLLSIIIGNLISNAVKYSKNNGSIEILILSENNKLECIISDNGCGIIEGDLDKIFDPFFRSAAVQNNDSKGSGLGLSIVKRLTEVLQLQINYTSKINIGTAVRIQF